MMKDGDFEYLEAFLKDKYLNFVPVQDIKMGKKSMSALDKVLRAIYFAKRR